MKIDNNLKNIFDSLYDGILIIDKSGIVVYVNPSYTRITKIDKEDIENKRLLDVRKDSHLTKVMKTGIKEIGQYRTINNIKYIVNMVPIIEEGKIVGGISVLNDMQDIQKNLDKTLAILDNLKEKVKILNKSKYNFDSIIAVDKNSIEIKNYSKKISLNDSNILITGESGTGKKIYAHAIHNRSNRASFPFISINCTTFSKENLEKELFGSEQDVFYDEKRRKIGLLQLVDGGTLFLDEISELDYSLQTKLLHVLQEKTLTQIGGLKEIPIDFRLICTTNKDLLELVNQGKFRKDLYYRISVIPLKLLPLKNRRGDIPALADKFLKDLSKKYRKEVSFSEDVIKLLSNYDWSGNIRELRNIVEFLFNTSDSTIITIEDLPDYLYISKENEHYKNLNDYLKECEKKYIKKILNNFDNSLEGKKQAAKLLEISLATLYNKLS